MGWENSTRRTRLPKGWHQLRLRILARDRYLCQIRLDRCTIRATQVDHIIPGDDHSPSNLRAACANCNEDMNIRTRPQPGKRLTSRQPTEQHPGLLSQ